MLSAEESAELRELQVKAYGRDGGLSAAELVRLQELDAGRQRLRLPPGAQPVSSRSARSTPREEVPVVEAPDREVAEAAGTAEAKVAESSEASETSEASDAADDASTEPRRRWPVLAAASIAILAIGLGVGWGIWGQQNSSIPLTDEQRSWQEELLSEDDYDPGSVVAVREQDGILAWVATRKSGEETCVLLSNGGESSVTCRNTDQVRAEGVWSELAVPDEQSQNAMTYWQVMMLFSLDGQPAASMSSYMMTSDGSPLYASDREREIAEAIVAQGFAQSRLWIAGYYGDVPVWMGTSTGNADESCLMYVDESDRMLKDCATSGESEDPLMLTIVDNSGATPHAVTMSYGMSLGAPSNLTVTIRPVSGVVLDTETGDVIEITTDDPAG